MPKNGGGQGLSRPRSNRVGPTPVATIKTIKIPMSTYHEMVREYQRISGEDVNHLMNPRHKNGYVTLENTYLPSYAQLYASRSLQNLNKTLNKFRRTENPEHLREAYQHLKNATEAFSLTDKIEVLENKQDTYQMSLKLAKDKVLLENILEQYNINP
jgi:hypothetical protein